MKKSPFFSLLLASQSPRRRQLLEAVGFSHRVVLPSVDEREAKPGESDAVALWNAVAKARSIPPGEIKDGEVIVSADTIVVVDDIAIGKPTDRHDAKRILETLSGRTHVVVSGLCLRSKILGERTGLAKSEVTFRQLDSAEIHSYTQLKEPYDKAGAYAVQGLSALFIQNIKGSFSNVMGLPVELLIEELAALTRHSVFDLFEPL